MKTTVNVLFCLACCALSGCGMLATPHRVTIPHQSLQKVRVVDQETLQPLLGASVTCQMYEYKNWMKPVPFWGVTSTTNLIEAQVTERPDQEVWSWQGQKKDEAVFTIEPRKKTGWTQIWFPLPLPLGCFLYRSYNGKIIAAAPDHDAVWISNPVAETDGKRHSIPHDIDSTNYFVIEEEMTTIMLPKKGRAHNQAMQCTSLKLGH